MGDCFKWSFVHWPNSYFALAHLELQCPRLLFGWTQLPCLCLDRWMYGDDGIGLPLIILVEKKQELTVLPAIIP